MQKEALFWIWLAEALKVKSRYLRYLFTVYESAYDIFCADEEEISRIPDLPERLIGSLCNKDLGEAAGILDSCEKKDIRVLGFESPAYPMFLKDIEAPPAVLYCRGKPCDWNGRLCIGMVGTRNMSPYGLRTAYRTAYELASAGAIVVSGMASGVDGVSAAAAIAAGGETVAVLGCGVDVLYPRHHGILMEEICRHGTLLSEYPPGTEPRSYHFPVRNRIISGMSQGTFVVEASSKSGSLITAKDAILQGRDVYAAPSNVGSRGAEGTNGLLRDGAHLMLTTADLVEPYLYAYSNLDTAAMVAAQEHSRPDMAYLDRMGVIELTSSPAPQEPAPTVKVRGAQRAKRQERAEKKTEPPLPIKEERTAEQASPAPALSPLQTAVLTAMPCDRPVSLDALSACGYPMGEVLAALTMLELMGLVQKLPGGLYLRA